MTEYLDQLTAREMEVLSHVADGKSNQEIAMALSIAVHTVEQHLKHIYTKLEVQSRTQASKHYYRRSTSERITEIRYRPTA
ncbi:MAG: helix-turn-helix transcriptional regulator [Anaerolineales bacterium]|nr:helix-turn-helix transcriptional regulator [Anaerolineales bacterium]